MNKKKNADSNQVPLEQLSIKGISEDITRLDKEIKAIRGESINIIIGVLIAFILIIGTVAIEIIIFHTRDNSKEIKEVKEYHKSIEIFKTQIDSNFIELKKEIDKIKDKPK